MKDRSGLRNELKATRLRLKLSQQELADAAGVARQTIGGIEAELYAPSAAVALRLARTLGCTVEELFWLETEHETITAVAAALMPADRPVRVSLARVGDRWIAHPLEGELAFRSEMVPADGVGSRSGDSDSMTIELVDDPADLARTVVVAGCAPALSLWARSAERWFPGLRVQCILSNSAQSLNSLARGEVHIAGMHIRDPATGEYNTPFLREAIPRKERALVNLGVWEEGLLVKPGSTITGIADLAHNAVRIINRDPGSGCRILLDSLLDSEGIRQAQITGYDDVALTHQEVARQIAEGSADCGVSVRSIADTYGLTFVPLCSVRYDLALLEESLQHEPVRQLISTLHHRRVRQQLSLLGGFDTTLTGDATVLGK